jgi:hypothetical protein
VTVDLTYAGGEGQRTATVKSEQGSLDTLALFTSGDTLAGSVHLTPAPGKKTEHLGVKIEVLGQIEMYFDRGNAYDFVSLVREVLAPGKHTTRLSSTPAVLSPSKAKSFVCPHCPVTIAISTHCPSHLDSRVRAPVFRRRAGGPAIDPVRVQPRGDAARVIPRHQRAAAVPAARHNAAQLWCGAATSNPCSNRLVSHGRLKL